MGVVIRADGPGEAAPSHPRPPIFNLCRGISSLCGHRTAPRLVGRIISERHYCGTCHSAAQTATHIKAACGRTCGLDIRTVVLNIPHSVHSLELGQVSIAPSPW
jgi:hypothetical protein